MISVGQKMDDEQSAFLAVCKSVPSKSIDAVSKGFNRIVHKDQSQIKIIQDM